MIGRALFTTNFISGYSSNNPSTPAGREVYENLLE